MVGEKPDLDAIRKQIVAAVMAADADLSRNTVRAAVEHLCRRVDEKRSGSTRSRHSTGEWYVSVEGHSYRFAFRGGGYGSPGFALTVKNGAVKTDRIVAHVRSYIAHEKAMRLFLIDDDDAQLRVVGIGKADDETEE